MGDAEPTFGGRSTSRQPRDSAFRAVTCDRQPGFPTGALEFAQFSLWIWTSSALKLADRARSGPFVVVLRSRQCSALTLKRIR